MRELYSSQRSITASHVLRVRACPVSIIVGSIADGDTFERLIEAYPQLTPDDIKAALKFAAEAVSNADFIPLHRGGQ